MTDLVLIALITGVPGVINAVNSWNARKAAEKTKAEVREAKAKIDDVGLRVDGRLDQLLELSKSASFAAGVKQETDRNDQKMT